MLGRSPPLQSELSQGSKRASFLILTAALLFILWVWTSTVIQIRSERDQAIQAAIRQNQNHAVALEQYVLRTLDAANLAIDHIVTSYVEQARLPRPSLVGKERVVLNDPVIAGSPFAAASLVTTDGRLVASSVVQPTQRLGPSTLPLRLNIKGDEGALRVSPPMRAEIMPGQFIVVSKRVRRASFDGHVAVFLRPEDLISISRGARFGPGDTISVIGLDGVIRARRVGRHISFGQNVAGKLVMRMQEADPNITYSGKSSIDEQRLFFSHRRIDRYGLFVTSGIDERDVLGPLVERRTIYILAAGVISCLIIGAALAVRRYATRLDFLLRDFSAVNNRLSEAQRVGQIGDWEYDPQSKLINWSEHLRRMYGRGQDEAYSTIDEVSRYVGPEDAAKIRSALQAVLSSGQAQEYTISARLPDGECRQRRITAVPTFDEAGGVCGVHGTDQDITAEHRLRLLEARLEQTARLEAMTIMASTLAHEVNQPLAAASNYLAAAKRLAARGPQSLQDVQDMVSAGGEQILRAGQVIRQLRELAAGSQAHRTVNAVVDLIEAGRDGLNERGLTLDLIVDTDPDADLVEVNTIQVQQVFTSLFQEALDAAPGRRTLTIHAERSGRDFVLIKIADPEGALREESGEILKGFTGAEETSFGIGLLISRTIMEDHEGSIVVEPLQDGGASIILKLPAARKLEDSASERGASSDLV